MAFGECLNASRELKTDRDPGVQVARGGGGSRWREHAKRAMNRRRWVCWFIFFRVAWNFDGFRAGRAFRWASLRLCLRFERLLTESFFDTGCLAKDDVTRDRSQFLS